MSSSKLLSEEPKATPIPTLEPALFGEEAAEYIGNTIVKEAVELMIKEILEDLLEILKGLNNEKEEHL